MARSRVSRRAETNGDAAEHGADTSFNPAELEASNGAADHQPDPGVTAASLNGQAVEQAGEKRKWVKLFDDWQDSAAGVMLIHDRENDVISISMRDKPPEVVKEMFEAANWERDPGFSGYSKKLEGLRTVTTWREAEALAFDAANVIRAEKGMEPRESFYVSRG